MKWSKTDIKEMLPDGTLYTKTSTFECWTKDGRLNRLDGPAIIWYDGLSDWYVNGNIITKNIYEWANNVSIDLSNLTDHDKLLLVFTWS